MTNTLKRLLAFAICLLFFGTIPAYADMGDIVSWEKFGDSTKSFRIDSNVNVIHTPASATGYLKVLDGNLRVGNGTPTQAQDGEDAYFEGKVEIDGVVYMDGGATLGGGITLNDNIALNLGTSSNGTLMWSTTDSALLINSAGSTVEVGGGVVFNDTTQFGALGTVTAGGIKFNDNIDAFFGSSSNATLSWDTTENALLFTGTEEHDGGVIFDGTAVHNNELNMAGGSYLKFDDAVPAVFGSDGDAEISWNNTSAYLYVSSAETYFTGATSAASVVSRGTADFGGNITLQNDETISNSSDESFVFSNSTGAVLTVATDVTCTNDIVAAGGFKMPLCFSYANVDVSWTDSILNIQGETTNVLQEYTMPYAGSIIAEAVAANATLTTGSVVFEVLKNGVATGLTVTITNASPYGYTTQAKDTDTFAAGDRISAKLTSDSAVNPNTIDYQVTVYVEQ